MIVASFFDWLAQNSTALLDVLSMGLGATAIIIHKVGKVQHKVLIDELKDDVDNIRKQLNGVQSPQGAAAQLRPPPRSG